MSQHISLFCFAFFFSFFLATAPKVESAAVVRSLAKRQRIPPPSFRMSTKQAKFHTWRAQRKLLWLQFVLRHLARVTQADWMNELRTSEASHSCCCLHLVPLGPDFFFFFFTLTARWGSQGSTAAPLRPDWFFTTFHIKRKPVSLQSCKVNLLISQLLFSAEGDGCQRQVMFAHYINLEQQIKSWSDFNYCMHNLAEKRCENSSD